MAKKPDPARLVVDNATQHAIMLTDENGVITYWNRGGQNIFGYTAEEIIGLPASVFFTEEDVASKQHIKEMTRALTIGHSVDDRWHLRQDGTSFWASGVMTPLYTDQEEHQGFLKIIRDKTPEKLAEERALYLAKHDSLTGLANRGMFHEELHRAINQARLSNGHVQVLFIDLDRFKEINDTHGHYAGDIFLKDVAQRLLGIVRTTDLVARLGGDEFGIICQSADGKSDSTALAEKLVQGLSEPFILDGQELKAGASIGVTVYPLDSDDPTQILKNADLAMYAAKAGGRSTYRLYTEDLDKDAKRRRAIKDWLASSLEHDTLCLHYQPQVSLVDGSVHSIEALLRWDGCPVADLTSPGLIEIASETGLAGRLNQWTLRTACRQAQQWRTAGQKNLRIAVNVASSQLNSAAFLKCIDDVLAEEGFPASCLELEVTELTLMENNQSNDLLLKSLKKKGLYLSVDDFGTGFSSFSSLKSFPVDALKIDSLFVRGLPYDKHDAAIVSAIIGLAHSLDLKVVAEGVEHAEQADFLRSLGCDYAQGFLFAAPALANELFKASRA